MAASDIGNCLDKIKDYVSQQGISDSDRNDCSQEIVLSILSNNNGKSDQEIMRNVVQRYSHNQEFLFFESQLPQGLSLENLVGMDTYTECWGRSSLFKEREEGI